MRKAKHVSLLLIFVLVNIHTAVAQGKPGKQFAVPLVCPETGMRLYTTPRNFDGPGTIFRIDKAGSKRPVTVLALPHCTDCREEFAASEQTRKWSLGALLSYLNALSFDGKLSRTLTATMKPATGYRYRTLDTDVDAALAKTSIAFKKGNKYYLVRETVAFPSLEFDMTKSLTSDAKLKADIEKLVAEATPATTEGSLSWSDTRHTTLKRTFPEPYHVCYLVDELLPPPLNVASNKGLQRRPTEKQPTWVSEQQ